MDFRKYFSQAQDDANENFFNYDGYDEFDDYDGGFDNFDDDYSGYDIDEYDNADGGIYLKLLHLSEIMQRFQLQWELVELPTLNFYIRV